MAEEQKADGEREAGSTPVKVPDRKVHRAYSKVRRELSEDELVTPGAQRLLLDELDRLQRQVDELAAYRTQFHEADKRAEPCLSKSLRLPFLERSSLEFVSRSALRLLVSPPHSGTKSRTG